MSTIAKEETYAGTFHPADFQLEDIPHISERDWSANWSEMGAYKTSTVLWAVPRWAERHGIENPKVLIITTRSGKGTYFKHVPDQLANYDLFNLNTAKVSLILDGIELTLDGLPEFSGPTVCVAHYNVFSKRAKPKKKKEEEEEPKEPIDELEAVLAEYLSDQKKKTKPKPLLPQLQKIEWDVIILDEAHRIKDKKTGWTKEIRKLKGTVRHVMTGTGFINNPAEIHSLLFFLNSSVFSSYWRFREKFCLEDWNDSGFRTIIGVNPETEEEFRELVRDIGPRRTKKEVFKDLPDPIYSPVEIELNAIQRKMYDEIRDYLATLDDAGEEIFSPNVLAALQRLRQVCVATPRVMMDVFDPVQGRRVQTIKLFEPSSKLDAMMETIQGLEWDKERRDQVVVFSNFKDPIELAIERFKKAGISYIEMKQSDNDQKRYQKWYIDFPKKEHQVFICTLQLGSESISLTSASTLIMLDRSWSPKDNIQGESRVWRPPQEEHPNIIYINAKDTVDARILAKVNRKTGWFKQIFG